MPDHASDPRNQHGWNHPGGSYPHSSLTPPRPFRQDGVFRPMMSNNSHHDDRHDESTSLAYLSSPIRITRYNTGAQQHYQQHQHGSQQQQQQQDMYLGQQQQLYYAARHRVGATWSSSNSHQHGGDQHTMPFITGAHRASSFESSAGGSSNGGGVPPPVVMSGGPLGPYPVPAYPYGPYGYQHQHHYYPPPWTPPVEYICDILSEDVLSGRGGATNSHSGNRVFRTLVKEYQEQYLKAKKRDKPAVASIIVEHIRKKGGRFLRRCDTNPQGKVLWIDIGDEKAREKTCQALREGAPELRRRKHANSPSEEDEVKRTDSMKDTDATLTPASSMERTLSPGDKHESYIHHSWTNGDESYVDEGRHDSGFDGSIVIRPLARLMPQRPPVEPIPLDQLTAEYRDLYLRDFLPPCPQIRKKRRVSERPDYDTSVDRNERVSATTTTAAGKWPVVSV